MLHNQSTTSGRTFLFPKIIGKFGTGNSLSDFSLGRSGLMRVFYIMPPFFFLLFFFFFAGISFHRVAEIVGCCLRHLRTEKCQEPTGRLDGKKTLPYSLLLFFQSRELSSARPS